MIQFFVTYRVSHSSPCQSAPVQTTYVYADDESGVRAALVESLPFTNPDAIQIESIENQGECETCPTCGRHFHPGNGWFDANGIEHCSDTCLQYASEEDDAEGAQ